MLSRIADSWRDFAPFYEMFFATKAPVDTSVLLAIVLVFAYAFAIGVAAAVWRRDIRLSALALLVLIFFANRAGAVVSSYFMWYLPPFMALVVILAAYGLQAVDRIVGSFAPAVCVALALAYAVPLPWSMPIERAVQSNIEQDVRLRASFALAGMMGPDDTAAMEPLGYTGWAARNKTIYDYPGLGSKIAVAALKDMKPYPSLTGLIDRLRPTYALLRPTEAIELRRRFPGTADAYDLVQEVKVAPGAADLSFAGLEYATVDGAFAIYRRRD